MIWEELDDRLIFLNRKEKSAEELLEMAGEIFVQTGVAKSGYSQALLKREIAFPTGLDTGSLGIAIPHTESCWIRQNALGIIVPLEPVDFIRMGTDREHISVKLIFILAVKPGADHVSRLKRLMFIFRDEELLKALASAGDKNEIIQRIKRKEELLCERK